LCLQTVEQQSNPALAIASIVMGNLLRPARNSIEI
jgi:hypothetical protein